MYQPAPDVGVSIKTRIGARYLGANLSMEGVPHQINWWDSNILPTLVGGYFLTGVEQKTPNELVRELHEVVRPKLYFAYDRYTDAYLSISI